MANALHQLISFLIFPCLEAEWLCVWGGGGEGGIVKMAETIVWDSKKLPK